MLSFSHRMYRNTAGLGLPGLFLILIRFRRRRRRWGRRSGPCVHRI